MKINLSHGNGGLESSELIRSVFLKAYRNEFNAEMSDASVFTANGKLAFTTDSYVVKPIFFPGGDIGRLAVCGTVNDLLTSGATPKYLSAAFIIEEGFELEELEKIALSMAEAAAEAGVKIITGDTKVVEGSGGIYINTSGVGTIGDEELSFKSSRAGDVIIVSGNIGDHHACIMSRRLGIDNSIKSDTNPLVESVRNLMSRDIPVHGMRDITRGGLATVLNEITEISGLKALIDEKLIPVNPEVEGFCSILGLDLLHMANEGKMLIIVPKEFSVQALDIIKNSRYGENAAIVGFLENGSGVFLKTGVSGLRKLRPLRGEGLPRIC